MLLFSSKNFNDKEVNFLEFSNDFKIDVRKEKIKVIFGPNGIGKTSIYRSIKSRFPKLKYIDYDKIQDSVISNKDTMIISSKINAINRKNDEIIDILNSINVSDNIKLFKISNRNDYNNISDNFYSYKSNSKQAIKDFNGNNLDPLFELSEDVKNMFVKYGNKIITQEMQELDIEKIKNNYRKKYLEIIDKCLDNTEFICPICGNLCEEPVKNIVNRLLKSITESNNEIINDYTSTYPNLHPSDVLNKINNLRSIISNNKIGIKDLEDFVICGGNKEKADLIKKDKNRLISLESEINNLEQDRLEFYNNIKNIDSRIIETFRNQLNVPMENIKFDDDNMELIIKLKRNITEYSTGEINLITFMVTLLEFINSDNDTLIIDDPLSSYDIPNQYKIMYEITDANSTKNHTILVLTHNIDCVNIAFSQHNGAYEAELIDQIGGKLYLNPLDGLNDKGIHIDFILDNLNDDNFKNVKYLKLLSTRDDLNNDDDMDKIFHYDISYTKTIGGVTYNNEDLVNIISDFDKTSLINRDSVVNSANKILYLAALRVWIEKQLYDYNDNPEELLKKKSLGDKINYVFPDHWTGSQNVTRNYLMSKKVMLNQNEHPRSQNEPFRYALSISIDNIMNDILDIKDHFIN